MRRAACTSSSDGGFTLLEVLLGVSLSLMLAAAALQMHVGFSRLADQVTSDKVENMQLQVAALRLAADLRVAGNPEMSAWRGPILEVREDAVTLVGRSSDDGAYLVIQWEGVGDRLMRRVSYLSEGEIPGVPAFFADNKTMVEIPGSRWIFECRGPEGLSLQLPWPQGADDPAIPIASVKLLQQPAGDGSAGTLVADLALAP